MLCCLAGAGVRQKMKISTFKAVEMGGDEAGCSFGFGSVALVALGGGSKEKPTFKGRAAEIFLGSSFLLPMSFLFKMPF